MSIDEFVQDFCLTRDRWPMRGRIMPSSVLWRAFLYELGRACHQRGRIEALRELAQADSGGARLSLEESQTSSTRVPVPERGQDRSQA